MYNETNIGRSLQSFINKQESDNCNSLPISDYSPEKAVQSLIDEFTSNCIFINKEKHNFFELAIVLEGYIIFQIEDNYYKLTENQICIIDKQTNHSIGWSKTRPETSSLLWLYIVGATVRLHTTKYNTKERIQYSGMDITGVDEFLVGEAIQELKDKNNGYEKAVQSYLNTFLTFLYRKSCYTKIKSGNIWDNLVVEEARQYILNHLDSRLSLREISNEVAVSPNYLSLLFRQVTGRNIMNYIHEAKIREAKELLKSDHTLSEVAEKLGFYDQFHLSKLFKEYTGMSPSLYRHSMIK